VKSVAAPTTLRFAAVLSAALLVASCTAASRPIEGAADGIQVIRAPLLPDQGSLAVRCGALIDGVSTQPLRDVTVVIRDGRFLSIDRQAPPDDLPLLDLRGYTCLPGLIDMHTHLTERPEDTADFRVYFTRTREEQTALSRRHAEATLQAGFTTVRNLGSYIAWADRELRDAIHRGEVAGPRMQVTGFYLTIPGGGGDVLMPGVAESEIPAHLRSGIARGAMQFRNKAQRAVDGGADVLKVIASGAVLAHGGVPGEPEMTFKEIAAVANVAHAADRKVAAHAHGARSIKEAIHAGADTIEHASLIDDEGIELARERGIALAMDVYNGDYIDTEGRRQKWPEEFLRKNLETTEAQRQAFTRAHAAGVTIVYATDAGVFPHGENARQFTIMVERGMTPMQTIRSATAVAARHMGWSDRVGAVKPGLYGDLVAVRGDPLADVALLQRIDVVIKGGSVFRSTTH
jgi:imidazolonepropionase-like amidohydrolase